MHNQKRLKKLLALCLPLLIVLGVAGAISKGQFLKANDSGPALVDLQVNGEDRSDGTFETEEESVNIVLKAKERSLLELPYDEHVQITPLDESEQEYAYPQIGQADFKKETLLKQFEEANKTEETTNTTETTEEQVPEVRDHDSSLFSVSENDQKGVFYLTMEKDEVRRFKVIRKSTETKEVVIRSAQDNNLMQKLFQFGVTEQELTQAEIPVMDDEMVPEEDVVPKENSEVEQQPVVEEESVDEVSADAVGRSPRAVSKTEPFPVDAYITKRTGTAPFDTTKSPGYDTSEDDDIVRTWDQVTYNITAGISNFNGNYKSIKVRLDMELPDAWRKDSSGQIRQTAEFANGTLTDTGDGTKKSTRSSYWTMETASGSPFFTETINIFGGVNGDELKPTFRLIIEEATTISGEVKKVDQIIDGSVEPRMNGTEVSISAKPLVDIRFGVTPQNRTNFEKATGTEDKPYTMITNVGVFALLKPLPGRADSTSIMGSTYPVGGIEYTIKQKMMYKNEDSLETKELTIGTDNRPIQAIAYDGFGNFMMPDKNFTNEYSSYSDCYQEVTRTGMPIPFGYANKTRPPGAEYDLTLGIYNTGNPKATNIIPDNSIKVTNNDYKPVSVGKNKWLYNGSQMGSNEEPFSVIAMQTAFPYEYLEEQAAGVNSSIDYTLIIDQVKYEGKTQEVDAKKTINFNKKWGEGMFTMSAFTTILHGGLNSRPKSDNYYISAGDGRTIKGNKLWGSSGASLTDMDSDKIVVYSRWNANSFKYDNSRGLKHMTDPRTGQYLESYYGVGDKEPDISKKNQDYFESEYTWYSTVEEAIKHGEIVAVKEISKITTVNSQILTRTYVPLIVTGNIGVFDTENNPNVLLTNAFGITKDGKVSKIYPGPNLGYKPSTYDSSGGIIDTHNPTADWGDTLYIAGMTIRPNIYTNKTTYNPQEIIKWTVDGKVESGSENNHKVQFDVTIPKETLYIPGTGKDYQGNPLSSEPDIVENGDGSWTLRWIIDYMAEGSTYNPKVTFDTSIVSSKLNFVNNLASFSGKVVSEIWLEDDDSVRDTSDEKKFRTSTTNMTVTNSGAIVVDKRVDKSYIEAGNEADPAKSSIEHPTDFTYTVSFKNQSAIDMLDVRILDVLPKNTDGRGSAFNGSYSVVDVKQLPGDISGTVWYTTSTGIAANANPNDIILSIGWQKVSSNPAGLKNATAIMIIYDKLPPGKDMSFTITVRPENQKAGDIYVNAPSMNYHLDQHVQGVASSVRVVGRDLSGIAWYDDSLDGLIGNKPGQTIAEDFAKDIPVKLYRTSLENSDYKNQLVEESLTGEKFVDSSGNSLIKTDANGKYTFKNLPEGEYVAEFIIDGKIHRVTKQLVGDDVTKNSKADPSNNKTPSYTQPKINELASVWGQDDSINHVTDVNVGLIRPGTIKLFKYEAGTAIDGDKSGDLSPAEKATGTPLQYAVFDLYQGHTGSGTKLGTATTDENGKLQFDVNSGLTENLFPGDYSLVETKAPSGFELLKKPIKVTITEGNQVIQLYQDNDVRTDLPFTGGDNPMLMILLAAASLMTVGFIGLMVYYRQPKRRRHTR